MLSHVRSMGLLGIEGYEVSVECYITNGLPGFEIVGLPDAAVKEAVVRNGAVYLAALGGAGALMAKSVETLEVIAWPDLGCEAVRRLQFQRLLRIHCRSCGSRKGSRAFRFWPRPSQPDADVRRRAQPNDGPEQRGRTQQASISAMQSVFSVR